MIGAACQDDGYAAPRGYYQPCTGYSNPYYNSGYAPAPRLWLIRRPRPNYNQTAYTTVTSDDRGPNRVSVDDVVQQQGRLRKPVLRWATVPAPLGARSNACVHMNRAFD